MGRTQKQRRAHSTKLIDFNTPGLFIVEPRSIHLDDNIKWHIFFTLTSHVDDFIEKCANIRRRLNFPLLDPDDDIILDSKEYGPFYPKKIALGVYSKLLSENSDIENKIHNFIYNEILVPFNFSYNTYPFIEYIILYAKLPKIDVLENPCILLLFLNKQEDLFRTGISSSDALFLRSRIKKMIVTGVRATKKEAVAIEKLNKIIDKIRLKSDKLPKNIAFKLCAFRVFKEIEDTKSFIEDIKEENYNSKFFLKNNIESFKEYYKEWENKGFLYEHNLSDNIIRNRMKNLYIEYKKLSTIRYTFN